MKFFRRLFKASDAECIELLTAWYKQKMELEEKTVHGKKLLSDIIDLLPIGEHLFAVNGYLWLFKILIVKKANEKDFIDIITRREGKCIGNTIENIGGKVGKLIKEYTTFRTCVLDTKLNTEKIAKRVSRGRESCSFIVDGQVLNVNTYYETIKITNTIVRGIDDSDDIKD